MAINPHGGELVNRLYSNVNSDEVKLNIEIDEVTLTDLECIAIGAFSPLQGFLGEKDYNNVLHYMRLENGMVWPIPITLSISKEEFRQLKIGEVAKLIYEREMYGLIKIDEIYEVDKEKEAKLVFGTTDTNHLGVEKVLKQSPIHVAGEITMTKRPKRIVSDKYYLDPIETREIFKKRGWKKIVAFQTRNPIHRAHEYIQKAALETMDGLLIHPLVGKTKSDDIPQDIRMKSYEVLIKNYYPEQYTLLSAYPASMRYAGPREAILHAIVRKNYGCTHFIVGRDHAGVGNYYGTYDAQKIFERFDQEELEIEPLFFEHCFYCYKCQTVVSSKTCPHDQNDWMMLSGTKVREMLRAGKMPPPQFSRKEVIEVLIEGIKQVNNVE